MLLVDVMLLSLGLSAYINTFQSLLFLIYGSIFLTLTCFVIEERHAFFFSPVCSLPLDIVECPRNKLVPHITSNIAAVSTHSLTSFFFLLFKINKKKNQRLVRLPKNHKAIRYKKGKQDLVHDNCVQAETLRCTV